jgi:hypothetical protein
MADRVVKVVLQLLFAALVLVGTSLLALPASAATITKDGSVQVAGTVPGPPPATPPTIDVPTNGSSFDQKNITVSGTCIAGLVVKVYRNGVFAGSALCGGDGRYSMQIDLVLKRNDLVAYQCDSSNQASPPSNLVSVTYELPVPPTTPPSSGGGSSAPVPAPASPGTPANQLIIYYDYTLQGIFKGQTFTFPVQFTGGVGPYAVSIDWGDGTTNVFSRPDITPFSTQHAYAKPGTYVVKVRVADSQGQQAYLQLVIIVNGPVPAVSSVMGAAASCSWLPDVLSWGLFIAGLIIGFVLRSLLKHRSLPVDEQ